jgi:formiminotetrahydrofolate cyclodeaminase
VNELMKLPESDPRRVREWPGAVQATVQVPMAAIAAGSDLVRLCETLAPITNKQLHSDLGIAADLALAAAHASVWNVRVNAGLMQDGGKTLEQAVATVRDAAVRGQALASTLGG